MYNFTPKQQSLLLSLASGMTIKEAIKAAGYSNTSRASVAITPTRRRGYEDIDGKQGAV